MTRQAGKEAGKKRKNECDSHHFLHHWPLASEIISSSTSAKRDGVPSGGSRATVLLRAGCFPASCLPSSSSKLSSSPSAECPSFPLFFQRLRFDFSRYRLDFRFITRAGQLRTYTTFAARIDLTVLILSTSIVGAGGAIAISAASVANKS
ncbi:hypothetical protein HDV57DRAFT_321858 [Trichoderma longibrachiatum]|uniref:Uncharacterized protein n=1 Tax=Trichoderma longibrachiatum ATCC 18648 TaxID=983965 RepID=A0A2T4BW59_TRILO|nr:hypothetical protein M440DRAFT_133752 [Trichoderma longibrachiatum ATCC 18648]